jgi:hypothetical protein
VGLARVALAKGDLETSGLLWGAVPAQGEHGAGTTSIRWREELRRESRPAFLAAVARGRKLDLWDSAKIALADPASV